MLQKEPSFVNVDDVRSGLLPKISQNLVESETASALSKISAEA
jgi:hypothetical protein